MRAPYKTVAGSSCCPCFVCAERISFRAEETHVGSAAAADLLDSGGPALGVATLGVASLKQGGAGEHYECTAPAQGKPTADLHVMDEEGEPAVSKPQSQMDGDRSRDDPGSEKGTSAEEAIEEEQDEERSKDDDEDGKEESGAGSSNGFEDELARLACAFFKASTKSSTDNEDILPQEDSDEMKLSVFNIFAGLFPETVGEHGPGVKNKRLRLHFNKIGYQIYSKEQSRRVPAVRAKPGNPGYGFRRARWRDTVSQEEDRQHCEKVLRAAGCSEERISAVLQKVQDTCNMWDSIRRPSRPAGPGRPRRPEDGSVSMPSTPALTPKSPKLNSSTVKHKPLKAAYKPTSVRPDKSSGKIAGSDAGGRHDNEDSELVSDRPRVSTKCKGRRLREGGGKPSKTGLECRDDYVPNLVKDEASENELLPGTGRGLSASPRISFSPLDAVGRGTGAYVGGTVGKKRDAGSSGSEDTAGSKKFKMLDQSPLRRDGGESGWIDDNVKSMASTMSPSASWSSGGQAVQLRTCASLLPPLKLGDAAQCTLPPLSKTQPFQDSSFCGLENLEKLASLASSSEKLVSSKVSTSGGGLREKIVVATPAAKGDTPACKLQKKCMVEIDSIPHI